MFDIPAAGRHIWRSHSSGTSLKQCWSPVTDSESRLRPLKIQVQAQAKTLTYQTKVLVETHNDQTRVQVRPLLITVECGEVETATDQVKAPAAQSE